MNKFEDEVSKFLASKQTFSRRTLMLAGAQKASENIGAAGLLVGTLKGSFDITRSHKSGDLTGPDIKTDGVIFLVGALAMGIREKLHDARPLDAPAIETKLADEDDLSV